MEEFIKFFSSIIIILSSTLLGVLRAKKLSDREYILKEFISFLTIVENQIKYMYTLLPNAYEMARVTLKTKLSLAIGYIVQDMLDGKNLDKSIVENISKIEELNDYDKNIIINCLRKLGSTNIEGQISIINSSIKNIENQIVEAVEIKRRNSRIYRTVGMLSGIVLVVIFI